MTVQWNFFPLIPWVFPLHKHGALDWKKTSTVSHCKLCLLSPTRICKWTDSAQAFQRLLDMEADSRIVPEASKWHSTLRVRAEAYERQVMHRVSILVNFTVGQYP